MPVHDGFISGNLSRMKPIPPDVVSAMESALDDAEQELRDELPYNELQPNVEYPSWTFDGDQGRTLYVDAVVQRSTPEGLPVLLRVFAMRSWGAPFERSRLILLPLSD